MLQTGVALVRARCQQRLASAPGAMGWTCARSMRALPWTCPGSARSLSTEASEAEVSKRQQFKQVPLVLDMVCCCCRSADARDCRVSGDDLFFFLEHFYIPASGQAVVTGVVPSPPRFLPSIFIAHRVQQSHCSSNFHRVLLTHALALSASQIVHKKKSSPIYTSLSCDHGLEYAS